jgi:hypothetical protein
MLLPEPPPLLPPPLLADKEIDGAEYEYEL